MLDIGPENTIYGLKFTNSIFLLQALTSETTKWQIKYLIINHYDKIGTYRL